MLKLWATPEAGLTLTPVSVMVGISAATLVPKGTESATECVVSVIIPVAMGLAKVNAVMAFAEFGATDTVTIYAWVEPSAAVTMYVTGLVKSFATPEAGLILDPVVAIVGTIAVTVVLKGTVTAIVCVVSEMVPVSGGVAKVKALFYKRVASGASVR